MPQAGRRAQLRLLYPAPGRLVAEDGAGRRGRPAGRGGRLCLARAGVHALGRAQELVRLRDGALPQHRLRRLKSTLGGASAPANPSRSACRYRPCWRQHLPAGHPASNERHPRRVLGHLACKAAIHAYQARPTWQSSACCNGAPSGLGDGVETTGAGTAAYAAAIGGTSILAGSI